MDETQALARRIFADLNSRFRKEPNIDEYDFIPVLSPLSNKSPVIQVGTKLGLEVWAVKLLYQYAYSLLMQHCQNKASPRISDGDLASVTRSVILVNPDCACAWNLRKKLIEQSSLTVLDDLALGALTLRKHPKSPETYAHRKWLFTQLMKPKKELTTDEHESNMETVASATIDNELIVCALAAERYPNNYNAWSHRVWILQHAAHNGNKWLEREDTFSEAWTETHVSDHSGMYYRVFIIQQLCQQLKPQAAQALLHKEKTHLADLIFRFPGHEALWCYRRSVLLVELHLIHPGKPVNGCCHDDLQLPGDTSSSSGVHIISTDLEGQSTTGHSKKQKVEKPHTDLVSQETMFITSALTHSPTTPWQIRLANRHKSWLENFFIEEKLKK